MKPRKQKITISVDGWSRDYSVVDADENLRINQLRRFCTNHIISCERNGRDCSLFKIIWRDKENGVNPLLDELIKNVADLQVDLLIRCGSNTLSDSPIISFEKIGQMDDLQISRKVLDLINLRIKIVKAIKRIDRETKAG